MKALISGAGGMLARSVVSVLKARGHEHVALGRQELDVLDREAVERWVRAERPDVVIHCAAYTAVDQAEAEPDMAQMVNAESVRHLAAACDEVDARLVYPSTDYVFDGESERPYTPDDEPRPLSAYGRSKLAGERAAEESRRPLIVRTSWLFGEGSQHFVATITRLGLERDRLTVVDDQIGRPTWARTTAEVMVELLERNETGTFHATGSGAPVSWCGFAREILTAQAIDAEVVGVPTEQMRQPAARPRYSVLDCRSTELALGRALPSWRDSLAEYLATHRVRASDTPVSSA